MPVQENKTMLRRVFEEIWNQGKLDTVDELFAPEFVGHDPFVPKGIQKPDGFRQYVEQFRTAFPDVHFTIEAQIGEEDLVVTRWSAQGTFTKPFMGIKPNGRFGTVTGVTTERLAGGRVVETWIQRDDLGMLQRMGVVPELAAALV